MLGFSKAAGSSSDTSRLLSAASRTDDPSSFKALVAKDRKSKSISAHAVREKDVATDQDAVQALVED